MNPLTMSHAREAVALAPPGLSGRTIPVRDLSRRVTDAMFALLSSHFAGAHRAVFEADLAEKNAVILLEDTDEV